MSGHANQHIASLMGRNIAKARSAKGWTQRELAVALGTSERMVSRWESGKHRPSPVYEISLGEVLFDGDAMGLYRQDPPTKAAA